MLLLDAPTVQVSTCELMRNPASYEGRSVSVRVFVRNRAPHGIWLIHIANRKCIIDLGSLHGSEGKWAASELFGPVGGAAWHMPFTAVVRGTFQLIPIELYGHRSMLLQINKAEVTRQGFSSDRDPEGAIFGLELVGNDLEQYTRRPATEEVVRLTWRGGEDGREEVLRAIRTEPDRWIVQQVTRPRTGKEASAEEIVLAPDLSKALDQLLAKPGLTEETMFSSTGIVKDSADYLLEISGVPGTPMEHQTILHTGTGQGGVSGEIISLLMIAASQRSASPSSSR